MISSSKNTKQGRNVSQWTKVETEIEEKGNII